MLALPITIIVDNFIKVAQDEQQQEHEKSQGRPDPLMFTVDGREED